MTVTGVNMAEENGKPEGQKPFVVSFEREDDPNDPITGDRIVGRCAQRI